MTENSGTAAAEGNGEHAGSEPQGPEPAQGHLRSCSAVPHRPHPRPCHLAPQAQTRLRGQSPATSPATSSSLQPSRMLHGCHGCMRPAVIRSNKLSSTCALRQDTVRECTFQPVTTWRSLSRAATSGTDPAEASVDFTSASTEAALSRCVQSGQTKKSENKSTCRAGSCAT